MYAEQKKRPHQPRIMFEKMVFEYIVGFFELFEKKTRNNLLIFLIWSKDLIKKVVASDD